MLPFTLALEHGALVEPLHGSSPLVLIISHLAIGIQSQWHSLPLILIKADQPQLHSEA